MMLDEENTSNEYIEKIISKYLNINILLIDLTNNKTYFIDDFNLKL